MRKRILQCILLCLVSLSVQAWEKYNYYGELKQNKTDFREYLHLVLKLDHKIRPGAKDLILSSCRGENCYSHVYHQYLGDKMARKKLYGDLHLERVDGEYAVRDVYCQITYTESDFYSHKPGPWQIPNHNKINTEHTWPQSKLKQRLYGRTLNLAISDLHALFPTNSRANSSRSNHKLADVSEVRSQVCPSVRMGYRNSVDSNFYFEPPEDHKGNAARALFYMAVRYDLEISNIEETYLRDWHRLDPVDDFERMRNDSIAEFQKTRNPFIDYPEWVEEIEDF